MADLKSKYATKANLTITIASLANAAARASTAVDNGTNLYLDALVGGFIKAGAIGTSASGYVNLFFYASADDGTTYSDGATGTDAAHTLGKNARVVDRIVLDADAETVEFGPYSVADFFGFMPEDWGVIIENQSGAALDATGASHEIHYKGVHIQSV